MTLTFELQLQARHIVSMWYKSYQTTFFKILLFNNWQLYGPDKLFYHFWHLNVILTLDLGSHSLLIENGPMMVNICVKIYWRSYGQDKLLYHIWPWRIKWQYICIPSLKWFRIRMTKLFSGQTRLRPPWVIPEYLRSLTFDLWPVDGRIERIRYFDEWND